MAWNEPGDKKNDPWSGGGREQGPPDLDEVIRRIKQRFGGVFGGGGSGAPRGTGSGGNLPGFAVVAVAIVAWLAYDVIYIVEPAERGVVMRFGKFIDTLEPGPNFAFPRPFDTVIKVNIDEVRNVEVGYRSLGSGTSDQKVRQESLMLTRDENIVDVKFAVQYKVHEASAYLFNVKDPDTTLQQATESAVREIVGKSNMDFVLTEGRSEIANRAKALIQEILDRYEAGLTVIQVTMQDAQPPDEVQDAFFDAIKAREDEQRAINEAEAYSNDVLPRARGAAARLMEEANGYKAEVVARSQGEASRFLALLAEYEKAPVVTRERLYIESIESVLSNTNKVMLDVKSGNNLLYVPLDRMISRDGVGAKIQEATQQEAADAAVAERLKEEQRQRNDLRTREAR